MAFNPENLARRTKPDAARPAPHLWAYKTTDSLATVTATGYFNKAAPKLAAGDQILVSVVSTTENLTTTTCYQQAVLQVISNTGLVVGTEQIRDVLASRTISSTQTITTPIRGQAFPYSSSYPRTAFVPNITDGSAMFDAVNRDGVEVSGAFFGDPGNTTASSIASTANCIGLKVGRRTQSPETSYKVARSVYRDLCFYGLQQGVDAQGWSGRWDNIFINNCYYGFRGEFLNDTSLDLHCSGNIKDFQIDSSSGVDMRVLFENTNASAVASTVDGCNSMKLYGYAEHASTNRTDYLLKVGATTQCTGMEITLTVGASFDLTSGVVPFLLDRLDDTSVVRVVGSAGSMHTLVKTTSNCRARIVYQKQLGCWPWEA